MFIRTLSQKNKSNGHVRKYAQIVESRRINGEPRHVVLATLGRFDTAEGGEKLERLASSLVAATERLKLIDLAKDLKALQTRSLGPILVFKRLWEELDLGRIIGSELALVGAEFDVAEAVFNMVLNRLTEPGSKRQLTLWERDIEAVANFDPQHYYRALDYLIEHKEDIERGVFEKMKSLFNQDVDVVLFDTTTLIHYGDTDRHETLPNYGFSKDHRGDLKQVIVGVVLSKQGVPLAHEVFEGNKNDVTCFREMIERISTRFKVGKVVVVGDRGMISKANIEYLERSGYQYILGYRMRTIPKEHRKWVFERAEFRKLKNLELEHQDIEYEGRRLVVCYNAERAEKDAAHRAGIIEKLEKRITENATIHSIVDNASYRRFLHIRGDKPRIDRQKIERDAMYDGVFVLTTNTGLPAVQVVRAYKDLWQVEMAFRQLKTEIEMGPIYHWKDRRIRAHIMVCFLAFVLRSTLYRKLKAHHGAKRFSYRATINDLKRLRACELDAAGSRVKIRTELEPGAAAAFAAIGMRPPSRALSTESLETVVIRAQLCASSARSWRSFRKEVSKSRKRLLADRAEPTLRKVKEAVGFAHPRS